MKAKILASSFVMFSILFLYLVLVARQGRLPAPYVTAKEAFTLLKKRVKVPDLVYASFDSQNMDSSGHTKKFLISGCSPSQRRTYYMLSNGKRLFRPRSIKTEACHPTLDWNKMMDSPQILSRVRQVTGKTCKYRIIYKMDWDDPEALIMCWDPNRRKAHWQVNIDTVTGEVKEVYPKPQEKKQEKPPDNKKVD